MAQSHDDLLRQARLLEKIGQSVIALDAGYRICYWNPASERLYGFPADEVLGAGINDLGIIDRTDARTAEIAAMVRSGLEWSGECWVRHRDGHGFPIHATISMLDDGLPGDWSLVIISKDISQRKHREAVLRRMAALVESSGDAIIGTDLKGKVTSWNTGAARMFGWTAVEATGRDHRLMTGSAEDGAGNGVLAFFDRNSHTQGIEARWQRKDGSPIDVSLTVSPVHDEDGFRVGSSVIARDVTALKRLRMEADTERERLLAAQELAHVGTVEYNYGSGTWWHSREYARMIGLGPGEKASREKIRSLAHPQDRALLESVFDRFNNGERHAEYEFRIVRGGGEIRWLQCVARIAEGPDGRPARLLVTAMDITGQKRAQEVLEHQAFHDALTGLPNRYMLANVLQGLLDRGRPRVVVMFVDVDRFKLVNDGIGHGAGDSILLQLGERIRANVRGTDTVGRFGGDEFIVICEDLGVDQSLGMAERIRAATREGFELQGRKIYLNVSIGIARAEPGDTAETLLSSADTAMYAAKAAGGDRAEIFDLEPQNGGIRRLDLESGLRQALERNELTVVYQPIVDLATEQPVGMEALLRWRHALHGPIDPQTFIPVAEETGLIVPIGEWILRRALGQAATWRRTVPGAENLGISVNISVRQLAVPDFPERVRQAVGEAGIDPGSISLEITESVLMEQAQLPMEALRELHRQGIRLSIDDFGTGYSSLSYLRWLFARVLKIDKAFVDELGENPQGATLIELILGTARSYGLDVIAEGVETPAQVSELRRLGVPNAQGYHWQRPMPAEEVPTWLLGRKVSRGP
ncbi:EAL domain-containing protein [Pseudarthrobacter sp. NPDC092419]|uniref:sensor domain-containing protein n=1 Tax=Pseudarthrobacter sp. NPDC092419 TaxID=3364414 RepID=UPI003813D5D5